MVKDNWNTAENVKSVFALQVSRMARRLQPVDIGEQGFKVEQ
jgi:hypothetical protein